MIQDISNAGFTIENRIVTGIQNIEGNPSDWRTDNGSFQVILLNENFEYGIKIPNRNHGDSFKLMTCEGVSTWGRPAAQAAPIRKYTPYEFKATYALLEFHYEHGFGPKMGRIFDININGDTYFAFEQENLKQDSWCRYLSDREGIEPNDEIALNTIIYNEHMKPGGFIEMYRNEDALHDYHGNHVIAKKTDYQNYDIDYKADCSIFWVKDGLPKCFDIDYNGITAYFKKPFIDKIIERYSGVMQERNFSDYLYSV